MTVATGLVPVLVITTVTVTFAGLVSPLSLRSSVTFFFDNVTATCSRPLTTTAFWVTSPDSGTVTCAVRVHAPVVFVHAPDGKVTVY